MGQIEGLGSDLQMSKNKEEQARLQGLQFGLKIAEADGIEALREEVKRRGAYDIPVCLPHKVLEEFSERVKNQTLDAVMVLTLVVLRDEFGFGKKRLQQFMDRFDFKTECLVDGFTTWPEQLDILKEECGIELSIRMNDKNVRC